MTLRRPSIPRLTASLIAIVLAVAFAGGSAIADDALYQAFGKRDGLARIVDDATTHWLADERIKGDFDNLNIQRFKKRLTDQLCELIGGPCKYTGRNMYQTHKGLHLDVAHFNALVEGLQLAMDKYEVPFRTQNRLLAILAPMEHDVVTR